MFLKLGATAFGGPAAHVALMEEEFVHRRQWLSREKFLDLIALTNLIPGPNSTELAIHIGHQRAGWWGFAIAGLCFILPAFILVTVIAYFYQKYASLPQAGSFLIGAQVVVLAIILQAFFRFFKSLFKLEQARDFFRRDTWSSPRASVIAFILIGSVYLSFQSWPEITILLNCGLISLFVSRRFTVERKFELGSLFLIFLKIGSVLFGSGYVLLTFLNSEFVEHRQWLTETQLLDAISVGQFTPGPVFTTASFIGYLLEGFSGAALATLGIFLPAFFFVALTIPLYKKMSQSLTLRLFLDGVVAGSLGLLLFTLWTFSQRLSHAPANILLFAVAFILLMRTKIPSALLILLGGLFTAFL
ncbi:chromate efflux transporter [Bdellovibrio sp. 22V]|uniref:chromate efflux transporter n=1 Tax=Bdellovibrio TaxID=958 RepID=UPI002542D9DA|nr:chromate efflux transporter [Bdellovibrio sp. 22V]WII70898.1 chromate efflux transporter [Bdellovibrio sp. 22V]